MKWAQTVFNYCKKVEGTDVVKGFIAQANITSIILII